MFNPAEFVGYIHHVANGYDQANVKMKLGYVTAYDPTNYAVRVRIEPESYANEQQGLDHIVESNWLPIFRIYGGNGWGMVTPPNADPNPPYGDQCLVLFPDGGQGIAFIGTFNDVERVYKSRSIGDGSSTSTPEAGEFVCIHESGSIIRLFKNGRVMIMDSEGNSVKLNADGVNSIEVRDANDNLIRMKSGQILIASPSSGTASGVVTLTHLTNVVTQINATFATKQNGSGSAGAVMAEASAQVKATD